MANESQRTDQRYEVTDLHRRILVTGGSGFIGGHLIPALAKLPNTRVLNLDIVPPQDTGARSIWRKVDIRDGDALAEIFAEFEPTDLVHLAARTDMDGATLADYDANTVGTSNVIAAAKATATLRRLIVTSSQHVRRPGSPPAVSDTDYIPYGAYGLSKVYTENITRDAGLATTWTIVRPTTIWGPGATVLADGFWNIRRVMMFPVDRT